MADDGGQGDPWPACPDQPDRAPPERPHGETPADGRWPMESAQNAGYGVAQALAEPIRPLLASQDHREDEKARDEHGEPDDAGDHPSAARSVTEREQGEGEYRRTELREVVPDAGHRQRDRCP